MGLGELRSLAGALAWALDTIHGAGPVHGGMKPSNVLLTEAGPRVVGFGIARVLDDAAGDTERCACALTYAAPEQLTQGLSPRAADVFSLGAVLAFAATGHAPFTIGPRTVPGAPDLAGAPEAVLPLLTACLATDPSARPTPRTVARMAGHPLPGMRRKTLTVATVLLALASHRVNSAPRQGTLVDDGRERRAGADGTRADGRRWRE